MINSTHTHIYLEMSSSDHWPGPALTRKRWGE